MRQVVLVSSIKVDRMRTLSDHIAKMDVSLKVQQVLERHPLHIFRLLNSQPRDTLLMTHEWLMIPIMLALLNLVKETPYILILNGALWDCWKEKQWPAVRIAFYRSLLQLALSRSQAVICNSHYLHRYLCQEFPLVTEKAFTIHNGISERSISNDKLFPYEDSVYNFLTITNFEYPQKFIGLELLFQAMQSSAMPNVRLYILGKVVTKYGTEQVNRFIEATKEHYPNVDWQLFQNESVIRFFQPDRASFVYSSGPGGDSLPRAILEAQLAGMPTVVVDTNGCAETVIPGQSALVVPPNIEALKDAMIEIVSPGFDRCSMGIRATENVRTQFSWDKMAQAYAAIILADGSYGSQH